MQCCAAVRASSGKQQTPNFEVRVMGRGEEVTPFEDNVSAILSPIEAIRTVTKDTLIVEVFYTSNSK